MSPILAIRPLILLVRGWMTRVVFGVAFVGLWVTPGYSGVIVNPNNDGSTDVDPDPTTDVSGVSFIVGINTTGELLIDLSTNVNTLTNINSSNSFIGSNPLSTGIVTISGDGATWPHTGELSVGFFGTGTLNIENSADVTNSIAFIGRRPDSFGTATVTGNGSSWTSNDQFQVGTRGTGTLNIEDSGSITNRLGFIASFDGSMGTATVTGDGSTWTNTESLTIGREGTAILNITNGGDVINADGVLGFTSDASGTVTVNGAGSTLTHTGELTAGNAGIGTLNIEAGGVVSNTNGFIGRVLFSTGNATVTGAGSKWTNNDNLYAGGSTTTAGGTGVLNVQNGSAVSVANTLKVWGAGTVNFTGGTLEASSLDVVAGGTFSHTGGTLTVKNGSLTDANTSDVEINGTGNPITVLDNTSFDLGVRNIIVGSSDQGTLNIDNGSVVSNATGIISNLLNSTGTVSVTGTGSNWTNNNDVYVGGSSSSAGGTGILNVNTGATVSVTNTLRLWNTGTVNLFGGTLQANEITFDTNAALNFVVGTLHVTQSTFFNVANYDITTLSTGKTFRIDGAVTFTTASTLNGGMLSTGSITGFDLVDFQAGTFALTSDNLVVGTGGIAGAIIDLPAVKHITITNNATINSEGEVNIQGGSFMAATTTNNGLLQLGGGASLLDGTTLVNHATVAGDGRVSATLNNEATGQINVGNGEKISFLASGNTNAGSINATTGIVEFSADLINSTTGSITAQNTILRFTGGVTNNGVIDLSLGINDVFGDITINTNAAVNVTGSSSATFDGIVVNNGEFRVDAGSSAVLMGDVSGGGSFPGNGTILFEARFSPGNSPGEVAFGGDLVLVSSTALTLDLAGTSAGVDYDHVVVVGDLAVDGTLDVRLINGFRPQVGDTFDLLDFGSLSGAFDVINLPSLGGGLSFDISSLLTTGSIAVVPEPGTVALLSLSCLLLVRRRR